MKKLIVSDPVRICGSDLIGSDVRNFGWEARMYGIWQQCNITIMYPGHFPALTLSSLVHLRILAHLRVLLHIFTFSRIFAFHCASSRFTAHLRVSPRIFAFHPASSRFTAHLRVSPRIFAFHRASSRFTPHLRVSPRIFAFHRASSRFITHLCVSLCIFAFSRIFAFHHASSRSIVHLHISSQFSAHHRRSIHPLSSQFLGALHSIYYYIWLCLASYDYYFVMDPYITSFTYLERSRFASKPWEGAYVRLRVAMSVFTT